MTAAALPDVSDAWRCAMRQGQWEQAWRITDRIELPRRALQARPGFAWRPEYLRWDGTPLRGRSVLVRCEHGLGDTLQFMRFLPWLRARQLHLMAPPALLPLLAGAPGLGHVHDGWTEAPWPAHEVQVEIMELAYALRSMPSTVPPPYPHLALQLAGVPPLGLPAQDGLRVGLLWEASGWDDSRSTTLQSLAPLLRVQGARFFSLQQGPAAQDPGLAHSGVVPLSPRTRGIVQAAAAMRELDLVISVDSMPAHLSATLGRPTWLLLKHDADWRWMEGRDDSPWYPGMRLFRQRRPGDWASAIDAAAEALSRRASS